MDASELDARRLNAKEVVTNMKMKNVYSQSQMEQSNPLDETDVETIHFNRGSSGTTRKTIIFQGESDKLSSPTPLEDDSTKYDAEAKHYFWSVTGDFIYRHHVEPRVKLHMPQEESFPIPMKYIDVNRTTYTSLDVLLEKQIEDYWNVDGERELSDAWTGFTRFILLNEKATWRIHMARRETDEETNDLKTRQCMARYVEAHVWCIETQSEAKVGYRETKAR